MPRRSLANSTASSRGRIGVRPGSGVGAVLRIRSPVLAERRSQSRSRREHYRGLVVRQAAPAVDGQRRTRRLRRGSGRRPGRPVGRGGVGPRRPARRGRFAGGLRVRTAGAAREAGEVGARTAEHRSSRSRCYRQPIHLARVNTFWRVKRTRRSRGRERPAQSDSTGAHLARPGAPTSRRVRRARGLLGPRCPRPGRGRRADAPLDSDRPHPSQTACHWIGHALTRCETPPGHRRPATRRR